MPKKTEEISEIGISEKLTLLNIKVTKMLIIKCDSIALEVSKLDEKIEKMNVNFGKICGVF